MDSASLSHELPNVGPGPDPLSVATLAAESAFVVLLLLQSHRSGTCRQQVREISDEIDTFRNLNATVVAIVPGTYPKVRSWRRLTDPSFPILADDENRLAEAFSRSRRYGTLGQFVSSIGRAPMTVVLDCQGDEPTVGYTYEGVTAFDRPTVYELYSEIDSRRR